MINTENINYPVPKQEYKVLVRCFTFNQSKYIEDALNGFAMQKTNFPFVCLVMDDASTDGEQVVIKEWMDRECDMSRAETIDIPTSNVIIVPHKTNTSCTFAFYFLKQNLFKAKEEKMKHVIPWREQCEYEALCEGDDYWIDPLKLQKQVDFLDENPEYGLVHTHFDHYYQTTGKNEHIKKIMIEDETTNSLLKRNTIATLTTCFRCDLYKRIPKDYMSQGFLMGDYPMWIEFSLISKIKCIPDITSVYRILENSASHHSDIHKQLLFTIDSIRIRKFYAEKYHKDELLEQINQDWMYWNSMLLAIQKERFSSIKLYIKSSQKSFRDFMRYLNYLLLK